MHLALSRLLVLAVAVAALALAGCQPSTAPRQTSDAVKDAGTLASEALERGDYMRAAELYRAALTSAPEALPLHYGLGVSASFLARKPEAIRELTWVLEHGEAGSNEVRSARQWLLSVGALPRYAGSPTAAVDPETTALDQKPAPASVHGAVTIDGAPQERMQLFLMEHPSRIKYFRLRTDEQGHFRFEGIPPGTYKLTERAAGYPIWRLRVDLTPGQDVVLDLSAANSTKVRDDFPDSPPSAGVRS
jgi:Carboxypeptidase regulatory-like domain